MNKFNDLNPNSDWVNTTLNHLSLEEKIGQLLHPAISPKTSQEDLVLHKLPVDVGGIFLFPGTATEFKTTTQHIQEISKLPVLISSDLENGAGRMIQGATVFPDLMALAAGNNKGVAYELGKACALEGRAHGVHWTFGPVVDINANPNNPITNTRSLGDDPTLVSSLANEFIRGMQDHDLIATAKHFPGDGLDDRDQHICTTLNPLNQTDWFEFSGKPFQSAINLGVWSIMIGHIALPAFEKNHDTETLIPAVVSEDLVTQLLKKKMGFNNLVITDAIEMAGVTGYKAIETAIIDMINAGCDMLLYSNAERDFAILKQAVEDGLITIPRIDMATRKVLALKEVIGLHKDITTRPVKPAVQITFQELSKKVAQNAITLVRDNAGLLPLQARKQSIFCYHIRAHPEYNVDGFDTLLKKAGFDLTSKTEQDDIGSIEELCQYDVILILATIGPTWGTNRIRLNGTYLRNLWFTLNTCKEKMIVVSFGSPYLIYDIPWISTYINAYSPDVNSQKATLDVLSGKTSATGKSPVDLFRAKTIIKHIPTILDL